MKRLLYGVLAVMTIFSLTGCGDKEETNTPTETKVETQTETTNEAISNKENEEITTEEVIELLPEETVTEIQENLGNLEVSSDSNTISMKQGEKTTAIYHHDGEKITGFEAYVEYDTPELAEAAKVEGEADPEEMKDVESVTVEGSKLHVIFKESAYEGTTLEEIQQAVSVIQTIQSVE